MVLHELFGQLKFLSLLNRFYFEASWMRKHSIKGLYIKTLRNSLKNPLELFFEEHMTGEVEQTYNAECSY